MGFTEETIHSIEKYQCEFNDFKNRIEKFKKDVQGKYIIKEPVLQKSFKREFEEFEQNIDESVLYHEKMIKYFLDVLVLKNKNVIDNHEAYFIADDIYRINGPGKLSNASIDLEDMITILNKVGKFNELKNYILKIKERVEKMQRDMTDFDSNMMKLVVNFMDVEHRIWR